jgi:heterodisulfide reductase subunit C
MNDVQAKRAAKNEALFREVNENIKDLTEAQAAEWTAVLCECSDARCTRTIEITLTEYERVRSRGDRFATVAGHEDTSIERVVDRTDRYLVVEKTGPGAEVARDLDPRS